MTNEIAIQGYQIEEVRVIRNMIDPGNKFNLEQLKVFFHVCKERKLDPRLKQIYAVPRWNKMSGRNEMTIQTSIDGFRLIAERTGRYAPGKPTDFVWDDNGKLVSATAYIKKQTEDGTWHDVSATAFYQEYKPERNAQFWEKMPTVMLEKVGEARAIRRGFPDDTSGIFTDDEMAQAKIDDEPKVETPSKPVEVKAEKNTTTPDELRLQIQKVIATMKDDTAKEFWRRAKLHDLSLDQDDRLDFMLQGALQMKGEE